MALLWAQHPQFQNKVHQYAVIRMSPNRVPTSITACRNSMQSLSYPHHVCIYRTEICLYTPECKLLDSRDFQKIP